jgi:nitrogen regulatory protein PII
MSYLRVTILVPIEKEQALEEALKALELSCVHTMKVRGYGCNPNFYSSAWSTEVIKFELVIESQYLDRAKQTIKNICQTGSEDDGMISVTPLSELTSIKDL